MNTNITSTERAPQYAVPTLRRLGTALLIASTSLLSAAPATAADSGQAAPTDPVERSIAEFEGARIDLSKSWGDAQACWVDEVGAATCFRSEAEMDGAIVASGRVLADTNPSPVADEREGARAATCSSSLRLYRNNSYGGSVVYLSQRGSWINLSWYGFDNVVSSYRVGGCSSTFRSGSGGSGTTYWGGTWAWASRASMTGWNDVMSSVLIS